MYFLHLRETLGSLMGRALGLVTGAFSLIRRSRMFHPRGITFIGQVLSSQPFSHSSIENLVLPPYVLIRLSSAWWKKREWKDVLGVAICFSASSFFTEDSVSGDQDLLFATITDPWTMLFAPFTTHVHDFLDNCYFAVSPFSIGDPREKRFVKFSLVPHRTSPDGPSRTARFKEAVNQGCATFELRFLDLLEDQKTWRPLAQIQITQAIELDQEKLRFDPFRAGCNIHPRGWVHFLRKGAYAMGQWMRPSSSKIKK